MAFIINSVKAVLQSAGYRTGNANPGGVIPQITEPVVAVNLERVNMTSRNMVIRATVMVPLNLGAQTCEEHALVVCKLLAEIGGKCEMQPSKFDAKTEMFGSAVLATFQGNVMEEKWLLGDLCQVRFGGSYYLNHIVSFEAYQEQEEGKHLNESKWVIRVEEQLDAIRTEEVPNGITTITAIFEGKEESYNECTFYGRKRILRDGVLVQIWEATAASRTVKT